MLVKTITRTLYLVAGWLCILLGIIGAVLPLIPTTPFILVAAFCFSRSSERLHQYLLNNKIFGKVIKDWENDGVIPFKVKLLSTSMMIVMVSYPLFFKTFHMGLKAVVVITVLMVMTYIWTRPSQAVLES